MDPAALVLVAHYVRSQGIRHAALGLDGALGAFLPRLGQLFGFQTGLAHKPRKLTKPARPCCFTLAILTGTCHHSAQYHNLVNTDL